MLAAIQRSIFFSKMGSGSDPVISTCAWKARMSNFAAGTDGAFLTPAGIPTYGITGFFADAEGSRAHGLNEHVRVKSVMDGRTFLFELAKAYAAK